MNAPCMTGETWSAEGPGRPAAKRCGTGKSGERRSSQEARHDGGGAPAAAAARTSIAGWEGEAGEEVEVEWSKEGVGRRERRREERERERREREREVFYFSSSGKGHTFLPITRIRTLQRHSLLTLPASLSLPHLEISG